MTNTMVGQTWRRNKCLAFLETSLSSRLRKLVLPLPRHPFSGTNPLTIFQNANVACRYDAASEEVWNAYFYCSSPIATPVTVTGAARDGSIYGKILRETS